MLRGMSAGETLRMWGIHRGAGVLREMGAGLLCYIALAPVVVGAVALTFVIESAARLVFGMHETGLPENPMFDVVADENNTWAFLMLGLLAALWAPLVEESIMRGALYRHLRSRWNWL